MDITLDRAALLKALIVTARIVERRNTIPILSNILLDAVDGRLTIRGTDLDIEASASALARTDQAGRTTVPAGIFTDIIRKLPDGAEVKLAMDEAANRLILKSGRSRFQIGALPASDYPDLQAGEMTHCFAMPVHDVLRLITETSFAISTEETRYYLNGIFLHAPAGLDRHEGLRGVATDGHRLARLALPLPIGADGMPGIIVPRKLVAELGKLATSDGAAAFDVEVSATKIRFLRDGIVITSKLIDGTFPDYERVIPSGNDKRLSVARADFAAALDRVSTVSSERGRAVRLDVDADVIRLRQHNPDSGEATDEVDATFDGAALQIGFNGKYLAEVLAILDGDTVEIALADPGSAAILTRKGNDALLVVLMPMRV